MDLNERISKIIEYSELSSSEFADAVEVQRSSISHITSGRNKPSLDFLIKVKERFPELEWDWMITGKGEMLKSVDNDFKSKEKTDVRSPLDLFTMIEDDNFGKSEIEIKKEDITKSKRQEPSITLPNESKLNLEESQRLEVESSESSLSNQKSTKIKRIVIFFEDGKFESFEP